MAAMVFHLEEGNARFRHTDDMIRIEAFIRKESSLVGNDKKYTAGMRKVRTRIKRFSDTTLRDGKPHAAFKTDRSSHRGFSSRSPAWRLSRLHRSELIRGLRSANNW